MENQVSKIGIHVYTKSGIEAVRVYKEAFSLEVGEPWLDDEGRLIHQELRRNGELFMSVSDEKHHDDEIYKTYQDSSDCFRGNMMYTVYFHNEHDMRRAYELLHKNGNPNTGLRAEGHSSISCAMFDRFGVLWHLCVPKDWNASFVPK